jgi:hypothetical protein
MFVLERVSGNLPTISVLRGSAMRFRRKYLEAFATCAIVAHATPVLAADEAQHQLDTRLFEVPAQAVRLKPIVPVRGTTLPVLFQVAT